MYLCHVLRPIQSMLGAFSLSLSQCPLDFHLVDTLLASSSSLHVGTSTPLQGPLLLLIRVPPFPWMLHSTSGHCLSGTPLHTVYPSCSTTTCNPHFHLHNLGILIHHLHIWGGSAETKYSCSPIGHHVIIRNLKKDLDETSIKNILNEKVGGI